MFLASVDVFRAYSQIFLSSLMQSAILALATLGIVLIFKTSFTTNFAQGSIASFAAFIMFELMLAITKTQDPSAVYNNFTSPWWIYVIGLLVAFISAFIIGLLIDTVLIRYAKNITGSGKQMITMGMVLILTALTVMIFGVLPKSVPRIVYGNVDINITDRYYLTITKHNLFAIILSIIIIAIIFIALKHTKWGLGVRATASNEVVSSMMGVNTRIMTAMSWAIAGGIGAVAAGLYAPTAGNLSPNLMVGFQINAFLALIVGGASTFYGPVVVAIFMPIVTGFIAYNTPQWATVIMYIIALCIVLIKPVGIFGKRIAKKV